MKKTVLTFGLISGAILSAMMLITLPFHDAIGFDRGDDRRLHVDGARLPADLLRRSLVPGQRGRRHGALRPRVRGRRADRGGGVALLRRDLGSGLSITNRVGKAASSMPF